MSVSLPQDGSHAGRIQYVPRRRLQRCRLGQDAAGAALLPRPHHGPGPRHIVAALTDPVFGLPMHLTRFRCDTNESYGRFQQFALKDSADTALLDLRATIEPPPSGLQPEDFQVRSARAIKRHQTPVPHLPPRSA